MSLDPADPIALTRALVRCPSVTPREAGALALLGRVLAEAGFTVEGPVFSEPGYADVDNLFARIGEGAPALVFAGHVPDGLGWFYQSSKSRGHACGFSSRTTMSTRHCGS